MKTRDDKSCCGGGADRGSHTIHSLPYCTDRIRPLLSLPLSHPLLLCSWARCSLVSPLPRRKYFDVYRKDTPLVGPHQHLGSKRAKIKHKMAARGLDNWQCHSVSPCPRERKMMSVSGLRSVRALSTFPKLDTDRPCLTALSRRQTSHLYLSRFLPNLFLSPWPLFMNLS